MKTKQHKVALIAKKCVDLKLNKGIDAFFEFTAHVNKVEVNVYKKWDVSEQTMYSASCYLDGGWNSDSNASNLDDMLETLNSIESGLGFE